MFWDCSNRHSGLCSQQHATIAHIKTSELLFSSCRFSKQNFSCIRGGICNSTTYSGLAWSRAKKQANNSIGELWVTPHKKNVYHSRKIRGTRRKENTCLRKLVMNAFFRCGKDRYSYVRIPSVYVKGLLLFLWIYWPWVGGRSMKVKAGNVHRGQVQRIDVMNADGIASIIETHMGHRQSCEVKVQRWLWVVLG